MRMPIRGTARKRRRGGRRAYAPPCAALTLKMPGWWKKCARAKRCLRLPMGCIPGKRRVLPCGRWSHGWKSAASSAKSGWTAFGATCPPMTSARPSPASSTLPGRWESACFCTPRAARKKLPAWWRNGTCPAWCIGIRARSIWSVIWTWTAILPLDPTSSPIPQCAKWPVAPRAAVC